MRAWSFMRLGRKSQSLLLVTALVLSFLAYQSGLVSSQGSVGVDNDGPSFTNVTIEENHDHIYVHVSLRDLNGWDDIYLVNLTIRDSNGRAISHVVYRQYSAPSEVTPVIEWVELEGDYLDRDYSVWEAVPVYPWNPWAAKYIGLNVTFAFNSFPGETISIVGMDKGERLDPTDTTNERTNLLSCEFEGPFSAEFTAPPIVENYVIPIAISFIVAVVGASIMTVRRHYSNKLAKTIEAREAVAAED